MKMNESHDLGSVVLFRHMIFAGICCSLFVGNILGQVPQNVTPLDKTALGRKVTFVGGATNGNGEEYRPTTGKPGDWPGVVLIPDSNGLSDTMRAQARTLAGAGYLVLVVDMLSGGLSHDKEQGAAWSHDPPPTEMLSLLSGAVGYLQNWIKDPTKIAVLGWGTGASFAFHLASEEHIVKAVVMYFGCPSDQYASTSSILSPVLIIAGGLDLNPSPGVVQNFALKMRRHGKRIDVKVYPGSSHGFGNEIDASDADLVALAFLRKNLQDLGMIAPNK